MKRILVLVILVFIALVSSAQERWKKKELKNIAKIKNRLGNSADLIKDYRSIAISYNLLDVNDSAFVYLNKELREAVGQDSLMSNIYMFISHVELEEGNSEESIIAMNKALEISPSGEMFYWRFDLYSRFGKYDLALEDMEKVLSFNNYRTSENHISKGLINIELGNYNDAIKDFNEASNIDSNAIEVFFYRAKVYVLLESYEEALKDVNKYIKKSKILDFEALFSRGIIRRGLKRYRRAIEDFTVCIEQDEDNVEYYYYRAESKLELKEYEGAIRDYTLAIEIIPEDAQFYYFRALAKKENNDLNGACDDWVKSAALGDEDAFNALAAFCESY